MKLILKACAIVACLLPGLAGCGHVPVSTLVALRSFDALTFDPEQLRVAVLVPSALRQAEGGTTLDLTLTLAGPPESTVKHALVLLPLAAGSDPALERHRQPGWRLTGYRLKPEDAERVRQVQKQAASARREGGGRNRLVLGVSSVGCRDGALPDGPLPMTTLIRAPGREEYLVLLKEVDLRKAIADAGKSLDDELKPCAAAAPGANAAAGKTDAEARPRP